MGVQIWRKVPGKALHLILNLFTAVALIFEGYNQGVLTLVDSCIYPSLPSIGVMGGVSGVPGFIRVTQIGSDGVITNATKQGRVIATHTVAYSCLIFL